MTTTGPVNLLNDIVQYNADSVINEFFNNISSDENFTLFDKPFVSMYYDQHDMINCYKNTNIPLVLSINIRSLMSNYTELVDLLHLLEKNNILIYAIVLQETWNIKFTELVNIPGYQKLILKNRQFGNGGGVGIYVKNGLSSKIINVQDSFYDKIFESVTVEISEGKQKVILSSIYRSPSPVKNLSHAEQSNQFLTKLDAFLSELNSHNHISYVFLDSNIDLLNINVNSLSNEYADIILSNGFVQTVTKATRIQGNSFSLIDHILTNDITMVPSGGVLISDISDHFFTFIELKKASKTHEPQKIKRRVFSEANIKIFKDGLRNLHWTNVTSENDVDISFSNFWNDFKMLYDISFPYCTFKFNKNIHKKNNFMSSGLLISRSTKNNLHKIALSNPNNLNVTRYKDYRNLYNKLVRAMKQLYYEKTL